jgi:3-phosphoshikimate 1-carboxyvinyltransferase
VVEPRVTDPIPIEPLDGSFDAVVEVPGSKSLSNRSLLCAALAPGVTRLHGVLEADDTDAMVECLGRLGVAVERDGTSAVVTGSGGSLPTGEVSLDARLSGTVSRFLLPVLALGAGSYRLDGLAPLRRRPMGPLIDAVRDLGATVVEEETVGCLPVVVTGGRPAAEVAVRGDVSSQFVTALLLAAPCFPDGLHLTVDGPAISEPYVTMTAAVMRSFGAVCEPVDDGYRVAPGGYHAPADVDIEPDASSAAYFFAAAAVTGGRVRVEGLGRRSLQGDVHFADVLGEMGAEVRQTDDATEVTGRATLRGIDVDLGDLPDQATTLAAVAVFADGPTTVRNVAVIRGHETDRVTAVVTELRRCGIEAHEHADGFTVVPGPPQPAVIRTYDDHRMAMSFALLGLRVEGISIADPGCVAKTFPDYFAVLDGLRQAAAP